MCGRPVGRSVGQSAGSSLENPSGNRSNGGFADAVISHCNVAGPPTPALNMSYISVLCSIHSAGLNLHYVYVASN